MKCSAKQISFFLIFLLQASGIACGAFSLSPSDDESGENDPNVYSAVFEDLEEPQTKDFIVFLKKYWTPTPKEVPVILLQDELSISMMRDKEHSTGLEDLVPVVIWHGLGDIGVAQSYVKKMIQFSSQKIPVLSVQIGKNATMDFMASFFIDANYQVREVCKAVLSNKVIKMKGIVNFLGFSQGSQLLRALIERCPLEENGIKVNNFISLGGQHQGVLGIPGYESMKIVSFVKSLVNKAAYLKMVQEHSVQAAYWHNSNSESTYRKKNLFLADINNERFINETYKHNLLQLNKMVLVKFDEDSMVIPTESSHFGFFKPGSTSKVLPMKETKLYKEDRIGLKKLDETGRLVLMSSPTEHLEFDKYWFVNEIVKPYLLA